MNSYQAVVVGDVDRSAIRVRYIYQDRAMNWDLTLWGSAEQKFYPARIGTMFNSAGGSAIAEEYQYSGLLLAVCYHSCSLTHKTFLVNDEYVWGFVYRLG